MPRKKPINLKNFVVGKFAEIINPLNKDYKRVGRVTSINQEKKEATVEGYWWNYETSKLYHSQENYNFDEINAYNIADHFPKRC